MRWTWLPLAALGIAALVFAALSGDRQARATEVLADGGFEVWASGTELAEWGSVGHVSKEDGVSVSGSAARLTGAASLSQYVEVTPGSSYTASVKGVALSGTVTATLQVVFLDAGLLELAPVATSAVVLGTDFVTISVTDEAPGNAQYVGLKITTTPLSGDAVAVFDDASLDETSGAAPTATPTFTPTPTATPTRTPTPRPPPSSGGAVNPTAGCIFEAGRHPEEVLANAGFELSADGAPCYWSKFGGDLVWDRQSGLNDSAAAVFISLTQSTKWVFQVVPVEGGALYEASAMARVTSGEADLWIDLLWYASADGSGTNIGASESDATGSHGWSKLATGPVRAPSSARSVRFRLMLAGPMPAAAVFDDASLRRAPASSVPTATATPTPTPAPDHSTPVPPASDAEPEEAVAVPAPPRTGSRLQAGPTCDICLSEVMANPPEPGRDGPHEWIELENRTGEAIDVGGWSVGDAVSVDRLGAAVIPPGARLVIAGANAAFGPDVLVLRVDDGQIGSGLNNDADIVRLLRPDGTLADEVTYGSDAALAAAGEGTTLARQPDSGVWQTDSLPTPGEPPLPLALSAGQASNTVLSLPVSPGGARTDPAPWIVLGICSAAGVFSAPFAWHRLRRALPLPLGGRRGR